MGKSRTPLQLLVVAMQDLHDAESACVERCPAMAEKAGPALADFLHGDVERSRTQAGRIAHLLAALDEAVDGDPNIWQRAILDDADRDIRSTNAGPLRDTALIGAFRKGKQAKQVSYETAIALAAQLHRAEDAALLTRSRSDEQAADSRLQQMLGAAVAEAIAQAH